MEASLVSIVAVCYNHEGFLIETLESVLDQTYENIELFVVDDCSTDGSKELIKNWSSEIRKRDISIVTIFNSKNQGICKNLNNAIELCRGEYIQFISCDDVLQPFKIKNQIDILEKNSSSLMVYSNMSVIDKKGEELFSSWFKVNHPNVKPPQGYIYNDLIKHYCLPAPTFLWKAEVFKKFGLFREDLIFEDLEFLLRVSRKIQISFINEVNVKYRFLESSLSHKMDDVFFKDVIKVYFENLNFVADWNRKNVENIIFDHLIRIYRLRNRKYKMLFFKNLIKFPSFRAARVFIFYSFNFSFDRYKKTRVFIDRAELD